MPSTPSSPTDHDPDYGYVRGTLRPGLRWLARLATKQADARRRLEPATDTEDSEASERACPFHFTDHAIDCVIIDDEHTGG